MASFEERVSMFLVYLTCFGSWIILGKSILLLFLSLFGSYVWLAEVWPHLILKRGGQGDRRWWLKAAVASSMLTQLSWNCISQNSLPSMALGEYWPKRNWHQIWKAELNQWLFVCSEGQTHLQLTPDIENRPACLAGTEQQPGSADPSAVTGSPAAAALNPGPGACAALWWRASAYPAGQPPERWESSEG